jgi:hypothetical protein
MEVMEASWKFVALQARINSERFLVVHQGHGKGPGDYPIVTSNSGRTPLCALRLHWARRDHGTQRSLSGCWLCGLTHDP